MSVAFYWLSCYAETISNFDLSVGKTKDKFGKFKNPPNKTNEK